MTSTRATQRQSPVALILSGELTVSALKAALVPIEAELKRGSRALMVDLCKVHSVMPGAREHFVSWSKQHRSDISAIAFVTKRASWRMIVTALALTGSRPMRAFSEPMQAVAWLNAAN